MTKYPNTLIEYQTNLSKTVDKLNIMTNLELKQLMVNQLYHYLPKDEIEYKKMVEYINERKPSDPQDINTTKSPTYFGNFLENHQDYLFFFYTKDINDTNGITFRINKCTVDELIENQDIFINKMTDNSTMFPTFNLN